MPGCTLSIYMIILNFSWKLNKVDLYFRQELLNRDSSSLVNEASGLSSLESRASIPATYCDIANGSLRLLLPDGSILERLVC